MATKDKLQGRAGQTQTQCKVTMRHSLTPFRCYYQKMRRKRKEEKRGRKGEGEEGKDVMVKCGDSNPCSMLRKEMVPQLWSQRGDASKP